jgi:hypothetical protein
MNNNGEFSGFRLAGSNLEKELADALHAGRNSTISIPAIRAAALKDNDLALAIARSNLKRVDDLMSPVEKCRDYITSDLELGLTLSNLRSETIRLIQVLNAGAGE